MKTCQNCSDYIGQSSEFCFKCVSSLGGEHEKICLHCGLLYPKHVKNCMTCQATLSDFYDDTVYHAEYTKTHNTQDWMYFISGICPPVGLVIGCIFLARKEDIIAKAMLTTSMGVSLACTIVVMLLSKII